MTDPKQATSDPRARCDRPLLHEVEGLRCYLPPGHAGPCQPLALGPRPGWRKTFEALGLLYGGSTGTEPLRLQQLGLRALSVLLILHGSTGSRLHHHPGGALRLAHALRGTRGGR